MLDAEYIRALTQPGPLPFKSAVHTPMLSLFNGDCLHIMNELHKAMPSFEVDAIITDPPFGIQYDYDGEFDDSHDAYDGGYMSWSVSWIGAALNLLRYNGTFWLAIGDKYAAELKMLCEGDYKLRCADWVIWHYKFGNHVKSGKFTNSKTHWFRFVKEPPRDSPIWVNPAGYPRHQLTFNTHDIKVPSLRQEKYNDIRAKQGGKTPDDVWEFPRVCGTFKERVGWHTAQQPEAMVARIVRVSTNPGDVVLEPFGGSGTTLAVCKKLGRSVIGIEQSERFYQGIQERLAGISVGDEICRETK